MPPLREVQMIALAPELEADACQRRHASGALAKELAKGSTDGHPAKQLDRPLKRSKPDGSDDGEADVIQGADSDGAGGTSTEQPGQSGPLPQQDITISYGTAQVRGMRPYQEDRHVVLSPYACDPKAAAARISSSGSGLGVGIGDAATLHPPAVHPTSFVAIYDGHNGSRSADAAASRLHYLLAKQLALAAHPRGVLAPPEAVAAEQAAVSTALKAAFHKLDDDLMREARYLGAHDGATALVLLRLGASLYTAHIGDSRAVLGCADGRAFALTEDHKPNLPAERQRVLAAGGRVEFQRCWRVVVEPQVGRPGSSLAISRSFGDLDFKEPGRFVECEPDVSRVVLQRGDAFVVLGSDGLYDVMSSQEVVDHVLGCLGPAVQQQQQQQGQLPQGQQQGCEAVLGAAEQPDARTMAAGGDEADAGSGGSDMAQPGGALAGGGEGGSGEGAQALSVSPAMPCWSEAAARSAAESLTAEALRRGSQDNITVVVMLLHWAP